MYLSGISSPVPGLSVKGLLTTKIYAINRLSGETATSETLSNGIIKIYQTKIKWGIILICSHKKLIFALVKAPDDCQVKPGGLYFVNRKKAVILRY
jgi:hypothetical protein